MKFTITHSSTACTLMEIGPFRILTDPVFDTEENVDYRFGLGAVATRKKGPAIPPQSLAPLDLVLLTHAHHADNLDRGGGALLSVATDVITTPQSRKFLQKNFICSRATGLGWWDETTIFKTDPSSGEVKRITITATPALHGPWWLPDTDDVCGFILKWDGQKNGVLYISGDTVFFSGIEEIASRFDGKDGKNRISTAILHLGAVNFNPPWPPGIRFTFNGREAANTARMLGVKTVIPVHYEQEVWSHFKESRESYDQAFNAAGLSEAMNWLSPGNRTVVEI